MGIIEAILLGLLQGITEFLPVSSSGHLVLARALSGSNIEPGITFEIVVHFGSFCSIAVYYRKLILQILSDLFKSITPAGIRDGRFKNDENTRLSYIILLSMIPAMIVGFTLKSSIEDAFLNPGFVSLMLLVTGTILYSTKFVGNPDKDVNVSRGLWVGVAQAFAIIPGISRSGSTISLGLLLGIERDKIANFSFLMVLPVLAGAMLLEILELMEAGEILLPAGSLVAGFFTSFISGYLALSYLIKLLKRDKFYYFSFYCWTVGVLGIIYFYFIL
ncbi:undecaprenyl-diphosphate phosphatase [Rhodohalobacter sp. SW132]|uniref:undecaprenyl-diphosphate phosphatase n=1 Tax=Rhodohalobacter sp. SW132 TaxID=2293433 RepID=UPI000E236020|nr:undecaprenyl-diphosphate phosphatase [Rhodohalobacter sp. SW132]REL33598.1 undecaprenyl-diphosphate phosphatase [Rhodohalobacter sp. SW132]